MEISDQKSMTQVAIEALLRQKIGLDALTIGSNTITRAVNRRMADCGVTDIQRIPGLCSTVAAVCKPVFKVLNIN